MNLFRCAFIYGILYLPNLAVAQNEAFEQMSKVALSSPQAAGFAKQVEFPVSYFNGTNNVSIPIYEIVSGDIKLPISLSCNTGGTKTAEEASWVGFQWNLNVGGSISRQIQGDDDWWGGNNYFGKIFQNANANMYDTVSGNVYTVGCSQYNENGLITNLYNTLSGGTPDGEPDLFVYNFGGQYSGKFFVAGDSTYNLTRQNIRFTVTPDSIVAITPDGFRYSFAEYEWSWTATGVSMPSQSNHTAFYLTRIESPTGKKVVLKYKTFKELYLANQSSWSSQFININSAFLSSDNVCVLQLPSLVEHTSAEYYYHNQPGTAEYTFGRSTVQNISATFTRLLYLDRIEFDNGYAEFEKSPRSDLYGLKLDRIKVYRKDGSLFKNVHFSYDYFIGYSAVDLYSWEVKYKAGYVAEYPEDYRKKRLKLLSLATDEAPYSFEYYEGTNYQLPYKTSFCSDYWGFFNGGHYNTTLVPDFRRYLALADVPGIFSSWVGANREPDTVKVKSGMLRKITYPTKGSEEYYYEGNQYTNLEGNVAQVIERRDIHLTDIGPGNQQASFTLTSPSYAYITGDLFCDCGGNSCDCQGSPAEINWDCGCGISNPCYGNPVNTLYVIVEKQVSGGGYSQYQDLLWDLSKSEIRSCSQNSGGFFSRNGVSLEAGTYRITANYPDNKTGSYGSKMAHISFSYDEVTGGVNSASAGPGVRIKKITKYDPETGQSLSRKYLYTGGKLMRFPQFYEVNRRWKEGVVNFPMNASVWYAGLVWNYFLYASTITPYSFSANGNLMGYETVTEVFSDGQIGKIAYDFHITPDKFNNIPLSLIPGTPSAPDLKNGFLKKTTFYDKNNVPLKEIKNTPVIISPKSYWCFKFENGLDKNSPFDPTKFCDNTNLNLYPLQLGKLTTKQSVETELLNGESFTTVRKYEYNGIGLLKKETTTNSDGRQTTTEMKYPMDYTATSGWLFDLKQKNVIESPIERMTKLNGNTIGGSFVKYKTANNRTTPNEVYSIEAETPSVVPSTAPSGAIPSAFKLNGTIEYDANGNISYTRATDNVVTSYLRGYNNLLPIAVVQNALPEQIFHTSFEEATTNTSATARTGAKGYSAAFTVPLPSAGGTYRLTYWRKVGTADWELVETTMTANMIIGGGANTIIDEVRVFPATATMVTYTHDPLVGATSITDLNNIVTYYEYDALGRLITIRNDKRKIVKTYAYNYKQ
jgi:YD repeat-containing protein